MRKNTIQLDCPAIQLTAQAVISAPHHPSTPLVCCASLGGHNSPFCDLYRRTLFTSHHTYVCTCTRTPHHLFCHLDYKHAGRLLLSKGEASISVASAFLRGTSRVGQLLTVTFPTRSLRHQSNLSIFVEKVARQFKTQNNKRHQQKKGVKTPSSKLPLFSLPRFLHAFERKAKATHRRHFWQANAK